MRGRAWTAVQVMVAAAVVFFIVRYIRAHWAELSGSGDALSISAGPLAVAALIILGTYAMLIAAWRAVLMGWDQRLSYGQAARIWCLSNLARYIPGRIWQIAGMAALAQQAGVSGWAAAGSAVAVQLVAIATGALVTALLAPGLDQRLVLVAGLIAAGGAALLAWAPGAAWLSRILSRVMGKAIELRAVRPGALLLSALITSAAWMLYGAALGYCIRGLTAVSAGPDALEAAGVFTGSYVAGLVNIFTPGGLGTREFVLVNWLTGPLGSPAAVVVTVGSRILMTVCELIAAAITLPLLTPRADVHQA